VAAIKEFHIPTGMLTTVSKNHLSKEITLAELEIVIEDAAKKTLPGAH